MNTALYRGRGLERQQRLYPLLVVAAVSVTLFSLLGIAGITGYPPLLSGQGGTAPLTSQAASRPVNAGSSCQGCGVLESVSPLEPSGSGVGALIGALSGAVWGNFIGQDSNGGAIALAGGLAGASTGHDIEQQGAQPEAWQIHIRMDDGTLHTINSRTLPEWRSGTRVKLVDEQLFALPEK
jgi:outer membrane lipoprotein SlyB